MGSSHHHHPHPPGPHRHADHPAAACQGPEGEKERRVQEQRGLSLALVVAVAIFLAELVGGFLSHSLALKADSGHVFADAVGLVISLAGVAIAARPGDSRRTWGWYRLEILSALANGVLLGVAAALILLRAWERLGQTPQIHFDLMVGVASGGFLANVLVAALLARTRGSIGVRGAFVHAMGDAAGEIAVVMGGLLMRSTGWLWIDAVLSAGIALLIVWNGWRLMRDAVRVLLEGIPLGIELEVVREAIAGVPGVKDAHDIHIWTITSGMFAFSCHISVADGTGEADRDAILTAAKTLLHDRFGIDHSTIQVEGEAWQEIGLVH